MVNSSGLSRCFYKIYEPARALNTVNVPTPTPEPTPPASAFARQRAGSAPVEGPQVGVARFPLQFLQPNFAEEVQLRAEELL